MAFSPSNLSQQDPKWKTEQLGFDNTITIGTDGCALTSLTMLVNGYGFGETPSTVNKKLKDMGSGVGFLGGLIVWGALTQAFPKIAYQRIILCQDQPAPLTDIDTSLAAGQPVIVQLDRSPSPGLQSHWVVLVSKQADDYLMLDPWPFPADAGPVSLVARYGFNRKPQDFITAAVWYLNQGPAAPSAPPSGPGFYVQVPVGSAAGLNLRSAPATTASIVVLESAGTWLLSLEPAAAAQAKIGVDGQWINVQDPVGNRGYVAAWFVQGQPGTHPAPAPTPAPGTQLVVIVSAAADPTGLRLRDQPSLSGNVLATESAGTQLTVLETAASAGPKIGAQDQWLNVQDGKGLKGYVAAWYVQLPGSMPPSTTPAPAPSSGTSAAGPNGSAPSAGLTVVISDQASAGLRLRTQANANADTLTILPAGTRLAVVEPAPGALSKIGVNGQWLYVREPGGTAGYVAAWFVQKAS
jgi:hypothetical protein